MQPARDRITLGIALLLAVIAVLGQAIPYIALPLLVLAGFFIVWGREPERTEATISNLPGGEYLLRILRQVDLALSPQDPFHQQRKDFIDQEWATMDLFEKIGLYSVTVHGRPGRTTNDAIWQRLRGRGLVEGDFNGPKGIKLEYKEIIRKKLLDDPQRDLFNN